MQEGVAGGGGLGDGPPNIFDGQHSVAEVLSQLRKRLLDLTSRNRLLNFRHSPTKTVSVSDVVPNAVYDRLLENKTLTFVPVPDPKPSEYEGQDRRQKPDVREYAKRLGISISYDLARVRSNVPAKGNEGLRLRVLNYPAETERLCRRVSNEARSAIEETGTNMLYLVFGFLEFYEAEHPDRPLLAPLISVPVAMKRGHLDRESRLHLYDIAYTGEEVVESRRRVGHRDRRQRGSQAVWRRGPRPELCRDSGRQAEGRRGRPHRSHHGDHSSHCYLACRSRACC